MTNPVYGPSLFQARQSDHGHQHSHMPRRGSSFTHARSHAEFHNHRRDETADLDSRDTTQVVQTVSVVQIIDGTGANILAQSQQGSTQPNIVDSETGMTITANNNDAVSITSSDDADSAAITATPVSGLTSDPTILSLTQISSTSSLPPLPTSTFASLGSSANSTSCESVHAGKSTQNLALTFPQRHSLHPCSLHLLLLRHFCQHRPRLLSQFRRPNCRLFFHPLSLRLLLRARSPASLRPHFQPLPLRQYSHPLLLLLRLAKLEAQATVRLGQMAARRRLHQFPNPPTRLRQPRLARLLVASSVVLPD